MSFSVILSDVAQMTILLIQIVWINSLLHGHFVIRTFETVMPTIANCAFGTSGQFEWVVDKVNAQCTLSHNYVFVTVLDALWIWLLICLVAGVFAILMKIILYFTTFRRLFITFYVST